MDKLIVKVATFIASYVKSTTLTKLTLLVSLITLLLSMLTGNLWYVVLGCVFTQGTIQVMNFLYAKQAEDQHDEIMLKIMEKDANLGGKVNRS